MSWDEIEIDVCPPCPHCGTPAAVVYDAPGLWERFVKRWGRVWWCLRCMRRWEWKAGGKP